VGGVWLYFAADVVLVPELFQQAPEEYDAFGMTEVTIEESLNQLHVACVKHEAHHGCLVEVAFVRAFLVLIFELVRHDHGVPSRALYSLLPTLESLAYSTVAARNTWTDPQHLPIVVKLYFVINSGVDKNN